MHFPPSRHSGQTVVAFSPWRGCDRDSVRMDCRFFISAVLCTWFLVQLITSGAQRSGAIRICGTLTRARQSSPLLTRSSHAAEVSRSGRYCVGPPFPRVGGFTEV